jgi:hypothetical protein
MDVEMINGGKLVIHSEEGWDTRALFLWWFINYNEKTALTIHLGSFKII